MKELNNSLYNASYQVLTDLGIDKALAHSASRVVATDQPGEPNLGRSEADQEICKQVAIQININSQQQES